MLCDDHGNKAINPNPVAVCSDEIDYRESHNLTLLGGFLMTFKNQRRITMNARLTDENKSRGRDHLLQYLNQNVNVSALMYLWLCDEESSGP